MKLKSLCLGVLLSLATSGHSQVEVPLFGNTYSVNPHHPVNVNTGVWSDSESELSFYVWLKDTGPLVVKMKAMGDASGASALSVKVNDTPAKRVAIESVEEKLYEIGTFQIVSPGYQKITLKGVERKGDSFGKIESFEFTGEAVKQKPAFVTKGNEYWGMRGPSVHMNYVLPENQEVLCFYNELTVPKGEDKVASYFMSNGFGEGYFGIQVNSETERRVLFSVWSPFATDHPETIPADERVDVLRLGEDVHTQMFGGEGSGQQTYLIYPWKAGVTYKFLSEVRPDGKGNTIYTGYFCSSEDNKWKLMASLRRPKIDTYYTRPHSFLENFNPTQGYEMRKVMFSNQWAYTTGNKWIEITKGYFTYDNTARAGYRLDYNGGVEAGSFFLQNCGFFSGNCELNKKFERTNKGKAPQINFKKLEKLGEKLEK